MESFIPLKNTPIKEIIFSISFIENVNIDCLNRFIQLPQVKEKFTSVSQSYHTNIQNLDKIPEASISSDGYILKTDQNNNQIIQARKGSFSFHKVKEYESFDTLLGEFKDFWLCLKSCTGDLSVSNISVRYLNFIEKEVNEKIDELVTVYSKHPFSIDVNAFIHLRFNYPQNAAVLVNLVSAKGNESSKDGIILDINLNRELSSEKNDETIFNLIYDFRNIKNEIFFMSITEKTKEKFNS